MIAEPEWDLEGEVDRGVTRRDESEIEGQRYDQDAGDEHGVPQCGQPGAVLDHQYCTRRST